MELSAELAVVIANRSSEIPELAEGVDRFLRAFEVPEATIFQINLALDELLTNAISYGYSDDAAHAIRVGVSVACGQIDVRIVDDAAEFDPFARAPVDAAAEIEDRAIGGLGIHLVKEMMKRVDYRRIDGRNHVMLHQSFDAAKSGGEKEE
jgi:anti-sigma regulatory factor (Ser/Thr protein kinase)